MTKYFKENYLALLLALVFILGVILRPPLPVDETRYLTAAWELWISGHWAKLTVNFQPYHHKPPLLFWLINLSWSLFGVTRWAATVPSLISALAVIFLTPLLADRLFPAEPEISKRSRILITGSVPVLIYGSLIMFDTMLTAIVLAALLFLLEYAANRKLKYLLAYGFLMGLGVLTKGPVVYIHVLIPALLAPLWMPGMQKRSAWYAAIFLALVISFIPVLLWLVPALSGADGNFAYWLLWEQTAGRITGSFGHAHGRPIYFYLPLLPVFFLPWIFFPSFWDGLRTYGRQAQADAGMRFLFSWVITGYIIFSLISGKQPHYMLPFVPGFIIIAAFFMRAASSTAIRNIVLVLLVTFSAGHIVAAKYFFPRYDWYEIAGYVGDHQEHPWAFAGNYNGELGFLGRLRIPVEETDIKHLPQWFAMHPDGMAVIRYKYTKQVKNYEPVLVTEYRANHYAGVFKPGLAKKP